MRRRKEWGEGRDGFAFAHTLRKTLSHAPGKESRKTFQSENERKEEKEGKRGILRPFSPPPLPPATQGEKKEREKKSRERPSGI